MDILFLKDVSEISLDADDVEFVRDLANQRIAKRGSVLTTNVSPGITPIIQPVMPTAQVSRRRRNSLDSMN